MRSLLLAAGIVFAAGIASAAAREFTVLGTVTRPLSDGVITISHEAIPGYMPAMTMPFNVREDARGETAALQPGDRVQFQFHVGETSAAYAFKTLGRAALSGNRAARETAPRRRLQEGDTMPAFALTDQDGTPITQEDLRGGYTLLTFVFTRCPVPDFCPRISSQFQSIQDRTKKRPQEAAKSLQLLSITIDPEFDTPPVLRRYGERYAAESKTWRFATGPTAEIDTLRRAFAVAAEKSPALLDHTLATALIDPELRIVQIWRGNRWKPDDIFAALSRAPSTAPTTGR